VKFGPLFDVFALHALYKMFWARFHDMCVQKRSCLLWNSDAFRKFSAGKFYRKGSRRNSTICESNNEAVCCEVQTHFGSFRLSSFIKIVLDAFSTIYASKNKTVYRGVQTHFRSSLPASFTTKVLGAIPRFVRLKTKLFAVKFRRISKVFCLQGLQKKLRAQFHDLCVQKRSCLLWSSDAFWKFSACEFYRKSSGGNSTICSSKNEAVCREIQAHFESILPARFTEKVLGAIPRFMCPKMKRFAVKFRRILEVLALRALWTMFWAHFLYLCV